MNELLQVRATHEPAESYLKVERKSNLPWSGGRFISTGGTRGGSIYLFSSLFCFFMRGSLSSLLIVTVAA